MKATARKPKSPRPPSRPAPSCAVTFRWTAGPPAQALAALIRSIFPRSSLSSGQRDRFLVASAGRRIIGFSHLRLQSASIYLQGVGVHPVWRRRGLGHELVGRVLSYCRQKFSERSLRLKVKAANLPALRLYAGQGFILSRQLGGVWVLSRRENT